MVELSCTGVRENGGGVVVSDPCTVDSPLPPIVPSYMLSENDPAVLIGKYF